MAPKLLKALLICCLLQASLTSSSEVMREFVEAMDEIAVVEKQRDDYTMEAHQHLQLQRALLRAATPRHLANNNGNDDGNGSSGSVDLTKFALEYIGCSNIRSWDDDEAENKDSTSPLSMYRFVILRLCEASSCSAYNRWGCSSNYGEYMIPMEDYLQIMFNHHTTQFGYYCNLCQKCMNYNPSSSSSSYTDDANSGNDDGWSSYSQYWGTEITDDEGAADAATDDGNNAAADGDDYYSDDVVVDDAYNYDNDNNRQRNRELANQQSQPSYISDSGTCKYESVCSKYKSACQNVPENRGIEQYFSCATFPIGNNGNYGYIGPHCQSDGQTIDIGFYTDESCNNFAGESENLKNYFSIDETDMDIYTSKTCIPCSAADSFALVTDDQLNDGGIYSLCSALYEPAAKCQKAFSNQYKSYQVRSYRLPRAQWHHRLWNTLTQPSPSFLYRLRNKGRMKARFVT